MRAQGLWLARVSAIRVVEITRISRAMVITAVTMFTFDRIVHFGLYVRQIRTATIVAWLLVIIWRSAYRTWLTAARLDDRYCRRVITIGTDDDTNRLLDLFTTHPELGVRVAGRDRQPPRGRALGRTSMWLGPIDDAEEIVRRAHVNGVIVSASSVHSRRLNELIRSFQSSGVHVHIATGIAGIDARRMRSTPLAHEPLLYIEAPTLGRAQRIGKRAFDIVAASFALLARRPGHAGRRRADQAAGPRPGAVPPDAGRPKAARSSASSSSARCTSTPRARLAELKADQRAQRPAVQDDRRSPGHQGSAGSCAAPASTSCPS